MFCFIFIETLSFKLSLLFIEQEYTKYLFLLVICIALITANFPFEKTISLLVIIEVVLLPNDFLQKIPIPSKL